MEVFRQLCRQYVTLEHDTCLQFVLGWNIFTLSLSLHGFGKSVGLSFDYQFCQHDLWSYFESNAATLWSCVANMFKRSPFCQTSFAYLTSSVIIPNHSYHIQIYVVSCRWCGNHHGSPSKNHFLSTSAHYPGRWFRNFFQYLGAFMPQWQVLRVWWLIHIIGLQSNDSASVWLQHIHSHLYIVLLYLEVHRHYWWSLSCLLMVSSLTGNQVVSIMFDTKTSIHIAIFVHWIDWDRGEDPGSHLILVQAMWSYWVFMIVYMILSIQYATTDPFLWSL